MLYEPGEVVPESGVYEATHSRHRAAHHVTAAQGDTFPDCSVCGGKVRFRFLRSAPPIEFDEDFR
jgi:hypothetical protein